MKTKKRSPGFSRFNNETHFHPEFLLNQMMMDSSHRQQGAEIHMHVYVYTSPLFVKASIT